jgi:hypothetical protein
MNANQTSARVDLVSAGHVADFCWHWDLRRESGRRHSWLTSHSGAPKELTVLC